MSLPLPYSQTPGVPGPKKESRGPQRTSKTSNKLKVLPSTTIVPGAGAGAGGASSPTSGASTPLTTTSPTTAKSSDETAVSGVLAADADNGEADNGGLDLDSDFDSDLDLGEDDGDAVEFYNPIRQIPAGTARRDALRLTKTEKSKLPRVTAYCTAAGFNLPALQSYLSSRPSSYRCHPRLFDTDCLHTTYLPPAPPTFAATSPPVSRGGGSYGTMSESEYSSSHHHHHAEGIDESEALLRTKRVHQIHDRENAVDQSVKDARKLSQSNTQLQSQSHRRHTGFAKRPSALATAGPKRRSSRSSSSIHEGDENDDDDEEWIPDLFVFEYGTVVIWGMTEREEKRVLASLRRFEFERLASEDVEAEDLNFYYANYSRIYNDVITLRKGSSFMTKLSLSHALSQSVKISLFEELIAATIDQTKDLPKSLSETGKIGIPRKEIMQKIGSLFILRINWGGSILDAPEFFWSYPDLEPLYLAARSYLEINQRIELLNSRVAVLQDMLSLLKESMNSSHGERLEQIVIVLIGVEIILGIIVILIDIWAGEL